MYLILVRVYLSDMKNIMKFKKREKYFHFLYKLV